MLGGRISVSKVCGKLASLESQRCQSSKSLGVLGSSAPPIRALPTLEVTVKASLGDHSCSAILIFFSYPPTSLKIVPYIPSSIRDKFPLHSMSMIESKDGKILRVRVVQDNGVKRAKSSCWFQPN